MIRIHQIKYELLLAVAQAGKSGSGNRKVAGSIPGLRLLVKCRGVPEQDT